VIIAIFYDVFPMFGSSSRAEEADKQYYVDKVISLWKNWDVDICSLYLTGFREFSMCRMALTRCFVAAFTPSLADCGANELGVSTMLTDSLDDFVACSGNPDVDLPTLRDEFEAELKYYADKEWGYSPRVFPLLRKAVRGYVDGKLSREALEAVHERTLLCYFCDEGSEEELVEDLRGYIRAKSSNDLCAIVARMLSRRNMAAMRPKHLPGSLHIVQQPHRASTPIKISGRTAITATGQILRLVK